MTLRSERLDQIKMPEAKRSGRNTWQ